MLHLYAVCLNTARSDLYNDDWWIDLYWAEDPDHAEEQAENAWPKCAVVCVKEIPDDYVQFPPMVQLTQRPKREV